MASSTSSSTKVELPTSVLPNIARCSMRGSGGWPVSSGSILMVSISSSTLVGLASRSDVFTARGDVSKKNGRDNAGISTAFWPGEPARQATLAGDDVASDNTASQARPSVNWPLGSMLTSGASGGSSLPLSNPHETAAEASANAAGGGLAGVADWPSADSAGGDGGGRGGVGAGSCGDGARRSGGDAGTSSSSCGGAPPSRAAAVFAVSELLR